ncbi:MAG: hypothetical protein HW421_3584 [Ignavibacteria bacterium]|nr:hypothetical protein [Ignavibacteria bacterium]
MDNLIIEKTKHTLGIDFNIETGRFLIEGRSLPENNVEFFNPIFSSINRYISEIKKEIILDCKIVYFNSGSSKRFNQLFQILEDYHSNGGKVTVNWYYESDDEDQLEEGGDFAENFTMPFNLISY